MSTVSCTNLGIELAKRTIFQGVSLTCGPGSVTTLTGPSGCGKSTLLNALGLLLVPSQGDVLVDGESTKLWGDKRRVQYWHDQAAFIYQNFGTVEDETLSFNIVLNKAKQRTYSHQVNAALKHVGLGGRAKELASVLSGGEKQRLGFARAMFKHADVLYADEPTASLDRANRQMVIDLLRQRASQGMTVIVATHDDALASIADANFTLPYRHEGQHFA